MRIGRFRFRSSVLLKSIAAIGVALIGSTLITSVVSSRMTSAALADQTRQLGRGQLNILEEAYSARDRQLVVNLRNLGQIMSAQSLFSPDSQVQLIAQLAGASANLELDVLTVLDGAGRTLANVGREKLASPESVPRLLDDGPRSRLLKATDGTFVQAIALSIDAGGQKFLIVGGYAFDDQFAYALRRLIGSMEDVTLVASGRVVGSTLPVLLARPPIPSAGAELPTSPSKVASAEFKGLVAYVHLGRTVDLERGAIGLVLNDPVASLQAKLDRARLAATVILALFTLGLAGLLYRHLIRPLVRLAGTARGIADGDLAATFESPGEDEIAMLASALEHMRVELRTKLDLIARQADDLRGQADDLQESSQRIVAAEDNERHRLARDLHDGIQQELVVLRMRVGMATEAALHAEGEPSSGPEVVEQFEQLGAELDATIERLREVTRNLYPSILLDRGLAVAMRSYIRRLPMTVRLSTASEPFPRLDPAIESGAYFLLCEALTNAFKHARADDIAIGLAVDGDRLTVSIDDDGRGFSPEHVRGSGGLLHMHDRVRSFGGEIEIHSAPGQGTSIRARFPVRLPDDADTLLPDPLVAVAEGGVSPPPSRGRTGLRKPAG